MGGQRIVLLGLGVLVLLVGLAYCLTTRNFEFLYYISTLVIIGAGIFLLDRRVTLPLPLLWGLFLWLALHLAGASGAARAAGAPGQSGTVTTGS